ncbi:MAG: hypothetical protein AAFX07_00485 [Pseudomonadota bacterium]
MKKFPYLRSKRRRGRWFHTYRRGDKEISLGVHGLHPTDPRVISAWAVEHARWEELPPNTPTPTTGTFAWAVEIYKQSAHWKGLSKETQKNRDAILRRYVKTQGDRPLSSISSTAIETALFAKGGFAAVNELKALRPVFKHVTKLRFVASDPTKGIEVERPETFGFPTASAGDIKSFQERWPIRTTERLIFDLALFTAQRASFSHNSDERTLMATS